MEAKSVVLQNKGMRQDESISKSTNEYAYENYGIRITGEQDNTVLSVTNEKGPKKIHSLEGVYLGHCCVGGYIVVFTCSSDNKTSYIYRIVPGSDVKTLFSGDLGFNTDCPIESIGWYESEDIIKVYWIDDWHSPRFINIAKPDNIKADNIYQFDFTPQIGQLPNVWITKDYTKSGMFSQGTIQYFISYYNKFGAETGIVWQSSVQYISFKDRGAKADENVNCGFNIALSGLNKDFEYVRIYSAQRSSQDGPISARLVADIKIDDTARIEYTDLGTSGEAIDSTMLYYIGGQSFKAGTLAQKDGALFFGNIDISGTSINPDLKAFLEGRINHDAVVSFDATEHIDECLDIVFSTKSIEASSQSGYYSHVQQINHSQYNIATFKYGEIYRFALQFMTKTGEWTSAIWIGDKVCNIKPKLNSKGTYYIVANAEYIIPDGFRNLTSDYNAYRLLMAETSSATRRILAQGVVNPTLFNYYERYYNEPHSIASWNFRPKNGEISYHHFDGINTQYRRVAELQGLRQSVIPLFNIDSSTINDYIYYNLVFGVSLGTEMVCKLILYNLPTKIIDAEGKIVTPTEEQLAEIYKKIQDGEKKLPKAGSEGIDETTGSYVELLSTRKDKSTWSKVINAIYYDSSNSITAACKSLYSGTPVLWEQMPSRKEVKEIINKDLGAKFIDIVAAAAIAAAGVVLTVATWGGTAGVSAALAAKSIGDLLTAAALMSGPTLGMSIGIVGASGICGSIIKSTEASEIEKTLARKGWVYYGNKKTANNRISMFDGISNFPDFQGIADGSFWVTGGRVTFKSMEEIKADQYKDQYYIDNSIVTLNSPEIEDNQDIIEKNQAINMRVIGCIPINANYTDYSIETKTAGFNQLGDIIKGDTSFNNAYPSSDVDGLLSGYLYQDTALKLGVAAEDKIYPQTSITKYKTFLWNRETSLSLGGGHTAMLVDSSGNQLDYAPAQLSRKVFANIKYSTDTEYFDSKWYPDYGIYSVRVFNSDDVVPLNLESDKIDDNYYFGNYDSVVTFSDKYEILTSDNYDETKKNSEQIPSVKMPYGQQIEEDDSGKFVPAADSNDKLMIADPVRIKFKSTPHAVVSFKSDTNFQPILPTLSGEYDEISQSYTYDGQMNYELDGKIMPSESELNDYFSLIGTAESSAINATKLSRKKESGELSDWIIQEDGVDVGFRFISIRDSEESIVCADIIKKIKGGLDDNTVVDSYSNYILKKMNPIIRILYVGPTEKAINAWVVLKSIGGSDNSPIIEFRIIYPPKDLIVNTMVASSKREDRYVLFGMKYQIRDFTAYVYNGHKIYNARRINQTPPSYPYLYLAELYKTNFAYNSAYDDPQKINWQICSTNTDIGSDILTTYGDTYYQRWDCLKTYPFTEEDTNSIVDILSFMVETHKNLDGRCDINRGVSNILNARPTNWNLMNNAYTQNDDMIRYNVLDEKFDLSRFRNQVVWSLPKVDSADVDTWTNITLNNSLSLDGTYGEITKLISNANGALVAFQPKAISTINYNNSTALSTESGVPIEIANSGKVTGYDILHNSTGCFDKWAVCSGGSGIYFVDHYNKSMYLLNGTALTNLSATKGMSKFFRKITDNFETWQPSIVPLPVRLSYDGITNDVYINSGEYSLLYSEKLGSFTSFMPYQDMVMLSNSGKSLAIDVNGNIYEMFEGEYNIDKDGKQIDYYMDYRVNPEPYIDKVFTNIEYVADTFSSSSSVDGQAVLDRSNPFDKLEVWNEYQSGECELKEQTMPTNLRQKFRIWRAQIPRDKNSKYKLDRIRNPWCHIKLSKKTSDSKKMEFHQMTTTYFK